MSERGTGPRVFDLAAEDGKITIEEEADFTALATEPEEPAPRKRASIWRSLFWSALGLLASLWLLDSGWSLYVSLQAKSPWVGQAVIALGAIVALGILIFLLREIAAIFRLRKVRRLRERALALGTIPDDQAARDLAADLAAFYAGDATTASGRAEIARARGDIHDGATLMAIAERALLKPKDDAARREIASAARRVSVVTAVSPRAIIDILFVLAQAGMLIRRLSAIYGGRASGLGLARLAMHVASHLALTGGMAAADTLLGQVVGAGFAARLSAKLGEGVLNGVLTARVGIAALDLCRPMPFRENPPIILSEVASSALSQD